MVDGRKYIFYPPWSMAETFKGPILNSSKGIDYGPDWLCRVCHVTCPGRLMLASRTTARAAVPSEGRRRGNTSMLNSTKLAVGTSRYLCIDLRTEYQWHHG